MATMTQPTPGMRVKKTTFTEVIPTEDRAPSDAKPSPFYDRDWEIVVQSLTKDDWLGHKMRVYRAGEKWERGSAPIDNIFKAPFTEDDLRARFGGGKYVLWLYGPPKEQNLVGKYQVELDGQPIINSTPRNGTQSNGSEAVALEAMRMYSNPEFQRMQMQMIVTAATQAMELMKNQMPIAQDPLQTLRNAKEILGVGGPNPMDDIYKTLMAALVQKLLNPPETNSLDATLSLVEKIKNSGIFPGAAAKADLAATFVAQIPMLLDRAVTGFREFRLQAESQERTVRMQRGEMRPNDPNVIDVAPSSPQAAAASTAAAPAASAANPPASEGTVVTPEVAQAIIVRSHLHRLVAGIKDPKSDGQDMYDYIRNAWPEVLDELTKFSKEQLLAFFKSRETQMQYFGTDVLMAVAEEPRLPAIIEGFLKIAKENADLEKSSTPQSGVV